MLTFKDYLGREFVMTKLQWEETPHAFHIEGDVRVLKIIARDSKNRVFQHYISVDAMADKAIPADFFESSELPMDQHPPGITAIIPRELVAA